MSANKAGLMMIAMALSGGLPANLRTQKSELDLGAEYELILKKQSRLSAVKRRNIVREYEDRQRKLAKQAKKT